ncbi:tetratricopeptide repeat protein [Catenulispora pinisilvae]|uniref:tetratricopeptide repeat protein n=1 Tax=Catenulispora pinisilvae TaxID=2705253 RepID=UPI0018925633|nr:tetratricopeptide repeat protein [Catenulispora pinisilvae]
MNDIESGDIESSAIQSDAIEGGAVPDPAGAGDLPEYIRLLDRLRRQSGDLSYRTLARRVGPMLRPPRVVPHTTVGDLFQPHRRRLDLDLVVAIVRILTDSESAADRWRAAYVRVQREARLGDPPGVFRQLPADLATFTGREPELRQLVTAATRGGGPGRAATVVVTAIEGMAGVGKTQLAVHAAHRLVRAGWFGDVQMYANLRGFDPDRPPAEPAAVLDSFLRQLRVPAEQIPDDVEERSALFRDRIHGKDALVLLDNAAGEDQVRSLIPASSSCLVLITSRRSLAGLDDALWHRLGVFSEDEALALLAKFAGPERVGAEPEAARRIVHRCGLLPLAVSIAATRLRARPVWRLADLAERLERDEATSSDIGGAAFDLSYRDLPDRAKHVFRLLGIHPGLDVTAASVAAPAGLTPAEAERTLELLLDENLVQERIAGRYEMHDLIRAYAGERAEAEMTEAERRAAVRTALGWHIAVVTLTAVAISPDRAMPSIDPALVGKSAPQADNTAEAVLWYGRERANLMRAVTVAGEAGFPSPAWRLPIAMAYFEELAQNYRELERLMSTALQHAREDDDPDGETEVVRWLAFALSAQGRVGEAIGPLNRVLQARRAAGDAVRAGRILGSLAHVHDGTGDPGTGIELAREAIRVIEGAGGRVPSSILTIASMCLGRLGRHDEAQEYSLLFVERARKTDDLRALGLGLRNVGDRYLRLGRTRDAIETFQEAIAVAAEVGDRYVRADCLNGLALSLKISGLIEQARARHREAVAVFDDLPEQEAARYLARLETSGLRYVD